MGLGLGGVSSSVGLGLFMLVVVFVQIKFWGSRFFIGFTFFGGLRFLWVWVEGLVEYSVRSGVGLGPL